MKKIVLSIAMMLLLGSTACIAADFDSITNLTPDQKQKLSNIQFKYKQEYNDLETKIMEYNSKLTQLKNDKDKTPDQLSILSGAYERNLDTLKAKKQMLEQETDAQYKSILTVEQYKQLKAQETNVQDAFNKFLQK